MVLPTIVVNTALSLLPDRSYAVRSQDSLAVISPMYNEEAGAARALASLLAQSELPEHIALSINGGDDDTYGVAARLLAGYGFSRQDVQELRWLEASEETWLSGSLGTRVTILNYRVKTSKSDSINNLVIFGIVSADRVLVVDGDTVFHPDFVRHLRDNFYRLHVRTLKGRRQLVLEDYGLQSGSVTSFAPEGSGFRQRFISRGREAEYAFAGVLRDGQAKQLGEGALWGASRLYTVIGCGFAARRDLFPMPIDTETEDHDFTLTVENRFVSLERLTARDLERRGFRFAVDGRLRGALELFDAEDEVVLKRSGNARFVERALMATEDPPHFNGFLRQVERWNGGGQQSALKRLGRRLTPNVAFTLYASLLENVLGLLMLALAPLLLALNYGNPSLGLPSEMLASWLGADALLTAILVGYGFYRQRRAGGMSRGRAFFAGIGRSLLTTLAFLALRYLNPITYLASATRTVPDFLRTRLRPVTASGVVWERSFSRRRTRSEGVFLWTFACLFGSALGAARVAPFLNPINQDAWRLVNNYSYVDMRRYDDVPLMIQPSAVVSDMVVSDIGVSEVSVSRPRNPVGLELSAYCEPEGLPSAAETPRRLLGDPDTYQPLSRWGLLTLARLAPLLPYLETAATAYDLPADLYLQVLMNESYLDPLAVGDTDDKGISQMTSDGLTLIKALAVKPENSYYNPQLFAGEFSIFDPDFSICAGAAKLAWAASQPDVSNGQEAYALYINPVYGFVNGRISDTHQPLTQAMLNLAPLAEALANARAVYQSDPARLTDDERKLFNTAAFVGLGHLTLEQAYRVSYEVVGANDLEDEKMYEAVFAHYFGDSTFVAATP